MASQTYSASDLLRMRHASAQMALCGRLQVKLRKDLDLSEIVRVPPDRSLPLIEEETKDLSGQANGHRLPHHVLAPQLDGTDSEWKYRGRTDSEHDETQPISAPSTLAAQKDEGFQRFYKAVVSPTHVRVTAGGRIVPNTRGSSSPTSKWTKEKSASETIGRPSIREPPAYTPFPIPPPTFGPFPPMFPGFIPAVPPAMAPSHHPYPMMPWPIGFAVSGPVGMTPSGPANTAPTNADIKQSRESCPNDKTGNTEPAETFKSAPLSSPENFDSSRPFLYNGQWMMHSGSQFYPYGVTPFHGFQAPHALVGPPSMAQSIPGQLAVPNSLLRDMDSASLQQPQHGQSSLATGRTNLPPSYKPLISSIRPSEITKKQIEVLRGSLRYLEDQLQYNKHQIDEKGMEAQAQIVLQQIQQFEKNLESQLSYEKTHYPAHEEKTGVNSSEISQDGIRSKSSTSDEAKPDPCACDTSCTSQEDHIHGCKTRHRSGREKSSSHFAAGINSTKSVSAFPSAKLPVGLSDRVGSTRRTTTLPVTAALAPPFHPHSTGVLAESMKGSPHASKHGDFDASTDHPMDEAVFNGTHFEIGSNNYFEEKRTSAPYLVGRIPAGLSSGSARDTDYIYSRELTDDELRARHMYWGMAPSHLQKGLPKFDGKDFYPPSPAKGTSSTFTSSPALSSRRMSTEDMGRIYTMPSPKPETEAFQWFRPVARTNRHDLEKATQSESLERPEQLSLGSSGIQRPGSCTTQAGRAQSHFRKGVVSSSQTSTSTEPKVPSSEEDGDDDKALLFKGRKSMGRARTKTHNEIWQSVLKKGKSSANAAPGAVSSMTAQGVLPHYAGHATASLTPTIANTSSRINKNKDGDIGNEEMAHASAEKKGENLPPSDSNRGPSLRRGGCPDSSRKGLVSR